jgi:putative ABC transport system permease protein
MLVTALRSLAARKLRLLATGLAVTLGVAFMAGTLVLSDTITKSFNDLFAGVYEDTDAVVRAEAMFAIPDGFGEARGRVDADVLEVVRAVDGVAAAEGSVLGYAQLVDRSGEPMGDPTMGAPTLGGNWVQDERLNVLDLVAGRGPSAEDEVVIDKKSADDAGYAPGDVVTVLVQGGPRQVEVTGVARLGTSDSLAGSSFVAFTPEAAQQLVGEPGRFDEITVAAAAGVTQAELVERISAALPSGAEVLTGEAITAETQDEIAAAMGFFSSFMLVFAVVALLVGGFMIFNAFSITVAQRSKESALMRAVGASRRQVLLVVVLEALVVGVVASLIGLAAGFGVAALLQQLLGSLGFDVPTTSPVFTAGTAAVAFLAGLTVTLTAAISPARKAAKVPPVAAMRDIAVSSTGYGSRERVVVGSVVLLGGVAALLLGLFGDSDDALPVVGGGALLVFFGVSILGRTIALPLSRAIGWPLTRMRGIAGSLARENAMRNPKRTAATASALMIGVGLVSFITIFAASAKASYAATVDRVFTGDIAVTHVSGAGFAGQGGVDPTLTAEIAGLPEVGTVSPMRFGLAQIDGSGSYLVALDREVGFELVDVEPVAGVPADLVAGTIAVSERLADSKGLSVGDPVGVVFPETGPTELTLAVVYGQELPEGDWLIGMETYEANYANRFHGQVFVTAADGVDPADALAAIEAVAAPVPGVKVLDQAQYKADQLAVIDQLLGLVYAMLALAVLIALLGIANTLGLSILERVREVGLLRAVGMTRRQLRATIRWESVIIAVQGTIFGLGIGSFFGWALTSAMSEQGLTVFSLPVANLAVVVVLAALAGVLAAVLPARRAARLDVLRSIAAE